VALAAAFRRGLPLQTPEPPGAYTFGGVPLKVGEALGARVHLGRAGAERRVASASDAPIPHTPRQDAKAL
jgi:hypothetical protein